MKKDDIDNLIIMELEKGPKTPEQLRNIIEGKNICSRTTFFRHLKKLKEKGKIKKLNKDEIKLMGLNYIWREPYYHLVSEILEEKKNIFLEFLKNKTNINKKNIETIVNEFEKYIDNFYKTKELELFLGFYETMKNIYGSIPEMQLDKYRNYFINISQRVIKLYKENEEKNKNLYEDLYEKIKSVGKSLFNDYLFLFKKEANRSEIVYPVMDLLNELDSLPEKKEFLKLLIRDEHIPSNVVKDLLIKYLNYDKEELKINLKFIKEQGRLAYKRYLKNNSQRDNELLKIYDDVIKYFEDSTNEK
jgi:DNA-binding Lrp family transcriptional regulator